MELLFSFCPDLIEKYGLGEEYELPCPRCSHPVAITTGGVHVGQSAGSSTRVYCDPDSFECPKCFFKEPEQDEAYTAEDSDPNFPVAVIPDDPAGGISNQREDPKQVKDDVVSATAANANMKLKRVTQQDVMREQFNALLEKQINQKLKRKKLEIEILLLEKKVQEQN